MFYVLLLRLTNIAIPLRYLIWQRPPSQGQMHLTEKKEERKMVMSMTMMTQGIAIFSRRVPVNTQILPLKLQRRLTGLVVIIQGATTGSTNHA